MRTVIVRNREEAVRIIRSCKTCYVAMSANDQPYVLPMNFALDGDYIILHSAQSGRMWETLKKNPRVCINWTSGEDLVWQNEKVGCSYRVKSQSVIAEGEAGIVEDYNDKVFCMERIMAQYSTLPFRFNAPSIINVGIVRIHIQKITARRFGVKAVTGWSGRDVQG